MDGTASLANREIGRVLPANYPKVPFSGAAKHLNEAATARYFGQLSRESLAGEKGSFLLRAIGDLRHSPLYDGARPLFMLPARDELVGGVRWIQTLGSAG